VLRIVEARNDASIAVVTYACDGISDGDYVERFEPPVLPDREIGTTPTTRVPAISCSAPSAVRLPRPGNAWSSIAVPITASVQARKPTIFRAVSSGTGPVATIGTVYGVRPESATIRIESSVDAVYVGDLVAIHR
jgi:hypothetical protein